MARKKENLDINAFLQEKKENVTTESTDSDNFLKSKPSSLVEVVQLEEKVVEVESVTAFEDYEENELSEDYIVNQIIRLADHKNESPQQTMGRISLRLNSSIAEKITPYFKPNGLNMYSNIFEMWSSYWRTMAGISEK
jgi:predicted dinucleotide-utilizing enzyme